MIKLFLTSILNMVHALEASMGSCTLQDLEKISNVLEKIIARCEKLKSKINGILEMDTTQEIDYAEIEATITAIFPPQTIPDGPPPAPGQTKKKRKV